MQVRQLEVFGTNSYHNTVPVHGEELERREVKARNQEAEVLGVITDRPDRHFTPFQIYKALGEKWPITSIRRAMTNLTKQGKIYMTGIMEDGGYGIKTNTWRLRK